MDNNLTLCIIDDIQPVVRGISTTIPWGKHNITIAGTANDGETGLALLLHKNPDIVISDIRMPKLSGLDIMRRAVEKGLRTKFIFISGYSDFSYAQEAIKLGAFDYLLKPFTSPQILETVLKVKQMIEAEQARSAKLEQLELGMKEVNSQLRQDYLKSLLRQETSTEHLEQQWTSLHIDLDEHNLLVMVIEMDRYTEYGYMLDSDDSQIIPFAVQNILEETLCSHTRGVVLRESKHRLAAIMNPPANSETHELLEQCRKNVEFFSKNTISIGLGSIARGPCEIRRAFEHATKALSYKFYSGGNCVFQYNALQLGEEHAAPAYPLEKEKELLYALKCGNTSRCEEIIAGIFRGWAASPEASPEPTVMANLFSGLVFAMYRALCDLISEEERLLLEASLSKQEENRTLTFKGWISYTTEFCRMGCEFMEKRQNKEITGVIHQAKEYIHGHLQVNLTLNSCAQAVHLSPSYFANVFKKETGLTLTQYITQMRMEKAKDLLIEGRQVQEISLLLGYEDRPYFSELFKKHCGMTPTSFRQRYMQEK